MYRGHLGPSQFGIMGFQEKNWDYGITLFEIWYTEVSFEIGIMISNSTKVGFSIHSKSWDFALWSPMDVYLVYIDLTFHMYLDFVFHLWHIWSWCDLGLTFDLSDACLYRGSRCLPWYYGGYEGCRVQPPPPGCVSSACLTPPQLQHIDLAGNDSKHVIMHFIIKIKWI